MDGLINGVGLPLLVSLAIALGNQYVSNNTDSVLLTRNIEATEKLTDAVTLLNTQVSILYDRSEREKNGR